MMEWVLIGTVILLLFTPLSRLLLRGILLLLFFQSLQKRLKKNHTHAKPERKIYYTEYEDLSYILGIIFLFSLSSSHAQETFGVQEYFEGTITYTIRYWGEDEEFFRANGVPTKMTIHLKDGNYIIHQYDAQFPTTRLYIADSDKTYLLDLKNNRAFTKEKVSHPSTPPTAYPINDSTIVLGEMCYAYRVEKENERITYYVSNRYVVNTAFFARKKHAYAFFLTKGLNGRIPLKIIREWNRNVIETTAVSIKKQKFDPIQFTLPPGIKLYGYDWRR
jgi:hypothetical protein